MQFGLTAITDRGSHATTHWLINELYKAGLRDGLFEVRVPAGIVNYSPYHSVQSGSEAHPAYYAKCTRNPSRV